MLFCHSRRCLFKNARGFQVILNMHRESQYQPPFPLRETTFNPRFWEKGGRGGGQEKNECPEGLKHFLPQIFEWGLTIFRVKKRLLKVNMALRAQFQVLILVCGTQADTSEFTKACNRLTSINRLNMKITTKVLMFVFSKWWPLHW